MLRMQFLTTFQHFYKLPNSPEARLCLLGIMDSKQDRISVGAIQLGKESFCFRVLIQRNLKIRGNRNVFL